MLYRTSCVILISLVLPALGGDLEAIRAREKIAKAKLQNQVEAALVRSRKMDPLDARVMLEAVLRDVKDSTVLSTAERDALVRELQARLVQVKMGDPGAKVRVDPLPIKPPSPSSSWPIRLPNQKTSPPALLKTLNSIMSVNYDAVSFQDVVDNLEQRTGLSLTFEAESTQAVKLDRDKPITFKFMKGRVRMILGKILAEQGLTYIIKGDELHVLTPERARMHLIERSYDVADLITPANRIIPDYARNGLLRHNADQLIKLIQSTVEPNHWQPKGPGSITFDLERQSLIIRASTEMHYRLTHPYSR